MIKRFWIKFGPIDLAIDTQKINSQTNRVKSIFCVSIILFYVIDYNWSDMVWFYFLHRNGRCPYCRATIQSAVRLFINFEPIEDVCFSTNIAIHMLEDIQTRINAAINIMQNRNVPTSAVSRRRRWFKYPKMAYNNK